MRRQIAIALLITSLALSSCALTGGTLGGREKCWPPDPPRGASSWRGVLAIDASGGALLTPEGDVIALIPGTLTPIVGSDGTGALVNGDRVVAKAGADVSLFGGMGSDGALVVCDVEEIHSSP